MSKQLKSMNIGKAAEEIMSVMMFEQWVRFYYLVEREDVLYVEIPEERMKEIHEKYPDYAGLAEMLDGDNVTYEKCQATVCAFVGSRFDGQKYASDIMPKVFDSKGFQVELYMFQLWNRGHEAHLDERFHDFDEWQEMYGEWSKLEEVAEYRKKLEKGKQPTMAAPSAMQ